MTAELQADGGAAASGEEFFRSRAFLEAEGTTHTLVAGPIRLPLLVREIPATEGLLDAISPYGYPGAEIADGAAPPDPAALGLGATGLVSLFVRDRIGEPRAFMGGTERSAVQVHDPAHERKVRPRLAEQVRQNERAGWRVAALPGPEAGPGERAAFNALYEETMRRTMASARYLFGVEYFERILAAPGTWLLAAAGPAGDIGAGAIVVRSDRLLHYYLGGTADAALGDSPFKNVVISMLDLADAKGMALNLGGGVETGDGLERFKRGFANAEAPFITHEVVCDADAYARLSAGRDAGSFFPAYRAP